MRDKLLLSAAMLAATLSVPGTAAAGFVLDTGTPTGTGAPVVLDTAQFLAGEFAVTAGETITELSAFLTQGVGQPGDTFTFDIYSNTGFTSRPSSRPAPVFTATGTFTANGWNSTAVDLSTLSSGDYWLALQVASTTNTKGLDAPLESSTLTGTAPALAFAFAGSSGQYALSTSTPIGLEVTATTPVPLPASLWLLIGGIAGLGAFGRRSRR